MSAALDGPRIPAAAGRTSQLVVFLHGYGANGDDLIELGRQWRGLMPEAAFVSPHAPDRAPGAPMGKQWFPLSPAGRRTIPPAAGSAGPAPSRRAARSTLFSTPSSRGLVSTI